MLGCCVTVLLFFFLALWGVCTRSIHHGCLKSAYGDGQEILPPIMSGKIYTNAAIKYGRVNVRARIPRGDWLWPGKQFKRILWSFHWIDFIFYREIVRILACNLEVSSFRNMNGMQRIITLVNIGKSRQKYELQIYSITCKPHSEIHSNTYSTLSVRQINLDSWLV